MLDKMYDNAVAEVMSRCANDLQNQVALVGEVSDGIERLQDRALAYVSRSPTFEDADEDVKRQAAKFVVDDLFQLGPIEELLWDPDVSEIMVNSPDQVMVERRGKITLSDVHFFDEEHVQRTIARIVSSDGRRCDNQSPLCDCMLHRTGAPFDGSRVNAVAFGIAKHWTLDVRKFRNDALTPESLIANGSMDENMADFLQALVLARMNIVIEGGTGSGKSTLVHLLDRLYDLQEGRITIGGVDIRSFTRESLRSQIGLVLQEPFLFSQTIRENIAATRPGAPQEELRSAAAIACVDEAICEFPEGYETLVG